MLALVAYVGLNVLTWHLNHRHKRVEHTLHVRYALGLAYCGRVDEAYVQLACGDDLNAMLEHLNKHMRQGLTTTLASLE